MRPPISGYYADDTTEEWLDKLKSKLMGERPSTADKVENEKYENERIELERRENEKNDREFFFATQSISFNNTKNNEVLPIDTVVIPHSQLSTMKAKHDVGENTDTRGMFYDDENGNNSSSNDSNNSDNNKKNK